MNARVRGAGFALWLWAANAFAAPVPDGAAGHVEDHLLARAAELRNRFGATFYALAARTGRESGVLPVSPERSAPLSPGAIAAALGDALRALPASMREVSGLLEDGPERSSARLRIETRTGACCVIDYAYRFDNDGRIVFERGAVRECVRTTYE